MSKNQFLGMLSWIVAPVDCGAVAAVIEDEEERLPLNAASRLNGRAEVER
jgi:hypothetical protein